MVTMQGFRRRFAEFSKVTDEVIQANLDAALLEIDADIWGAKADQGQMYLAAHLLSLSPYGQGARMAANGKGFVMTTYYAHYRRLMGQVASGFRVA